MNIGDKIPEILGTDQNGNEIKASDLITTDTTATKLSNITINGKTYNVYKLNSTAARTTIYAAKK